MAWHRLYDVGNLSGMPEDLSDVVALAVLRHPTRMRIVVASQNPVTAEEIADRLGMPVTGLYHPVDRLRSVGLMEIVGERKRGTAVSSVFRARVTDLAAKGSIDDVGLVLDDARRDAISSHQGDVRVFGWTVATVPRAAAGGDDRGSGAGFSRRRRGRESELFTFTDLLAPLAGAVNPLS